MAVHYSLYQPVALATCCMIQLMFNGAGESSMSLLFARLALNFSAAAQYHTL
jgi:hypothetical protein